MKIMQKLKNILQLFSIKRDEAIYTCIKNNIPLTDANIKDIKEILMQKKKIASKEDYKNNG